MIVVDDKVSNGCQVNFYEESKEESEEEDDLYYRNLSAKPNMVDCGI
jgi:hypothetical protein